jgi:hypothetical protein
MAPLEHTPPGRLEEEVFTLIELEKTGDLLRDAPLEHEPPADLRQRSLSRLAASGQNVVPIKKPRSKVLGGALVAAAAAIAVLAYSWQTDRRAFESDISALEQRVEDAEERSGPIGHSMQFVDLAGPTLAADLELVHFKHDNYRLVLHAKDLPPSPDGSYYELWMRGPGGTVSAGSFRLIRVDEVPFSFNVGVDPKDYPDLELWVEPEDGNPTRTGSLVAEASLDLDHIEH